ncbi:MAG: heme ABC exporter ATP-binding protein CcmA [Chloroflexota bacterium]
MTPAERSSLINIRRLVKAFDYMPVLRGIDLSIDRGEFVALLGPNGSGKSTLIRLIAGLSRPTGGKIQVGGWELPGEAMAVRAQIGLVSHKTLLYDNLTAYENLRFFARLYNLPHKQAHDRVMEMLNQVGLSRRAHSLTRTFSRGMYQRLTIARALLHDPDVLLMDEPYTGLDQDASMILDTLLAEAHNGSRTIIMSTHQLDRAAQLSSRVIILSRGDIGFDAPTHSIDHLPTIYTDTTSMATAR